MKTGTRISDWARLRQQEIITGIAEGRRGRDGGVILIYTSECGQVVSLRMKGCKVLICSRTPLTMVKNCNKGFFFFNVINLQRMWSGKKKKKNKNPEHGLWFVVLMGQDVFIFPTGSTALLLSALIHVCVCAGFVGGSESCTSVSPDGRM